MLALALRMAVPPAIAPGGANPCEGRDGGLRIPARLDGGTAVQPVYSISGERRRCFHVRAGNLEGFVFEQGLASIEEYEKAHAAAGDGTLPQILKAETRRMRKEAPAHPLLAPVLEALDAGRPGKALRCLETDLLPRLPAEPGLPALAGVAAFQADDARTAESCRARSAALRPDGQLAAVLERLRAEHAADAGQDRTASGRFVLRYEGRPLSGRAADALLAMLDEEVARIDASIGCPAAEPLTVIIQSPDSYRAATGLGEWNGGLLDGRVRVPLPEGAPAGELGRTLAHELAHACLARRGVRERWLHEGLAMRLAGERPSAGWLREAEKVDRLPEWDASSPERIRLFSAWAWLAVERLFQMRGEAGVRELLRNPRALPAPAIR